ncbi:hypothetical protein ACS0TY_003790 [Phlomoides rotata]
MLRFLGKTTASAARSGGSSPAEEFGAVDEGLSAWELVNEALSDDDDLYSYDSDGVISGSDGVTDEEPDLEEDADVDAVISVQALSVSPPTAFPVEMTFNYALRDCAKGYDDDGDALSDVDDDDQYDYDVDDELVPWKLKDRFGKQRIKKMGKKGGPKLKKTKQLPYYDNRPGCPYEKFRGH